MPRATPEKTPEIAQEIALTLDYFKSLGEKRRDPATGRSYVDLGAFFTRMAVAIPNPRFYQPAADFEKRYGLSVIACHYNLPRGISAPELDAYAMIMACRRDIPKDVYCGKMAALWDHLVARNPDLAQIKYDLEKEPDAHYNLVRGIASAINPADLEYFVAMKAARKPAHTTMRQSEAYQNLRTAFQAAARMPWAAAPETLERIAFQLREKCAPPPQALRGHNPRP